MTLCATCVLATFCPIRRTTVRCVATVVESRDGHRQRALEAALWEPRRGDTSSAQDEAPGPPPSHHS